MKHLSILIVLTLLSSLVSGQVAPNFTITDSEGGVHRLYEDYLDKGEVVVIKMFFIACPICKPYNVPYQEMYEQFGSGTDSVQFLILTTKNWDSNEEVSAYRSEFNLTMPGSGFDGGGYDATDPYRNGDFGTFFGAPTFLVIEPDRTVHFDLAASGVSATMQKVRDKIIEVKGSGISEVDGTQISVNLEEYKGNDLPPYVLKLRSSSNPDSSYIVPNSFVYPSLEYPILDEAELIVEIDEYDKKGITTLDLVVIQRHILEILELDRIQLIAADVNGSGNASGADLLSMRKLILQLKDEFLVGRSWVGIDSRCLEDPDNCTEAVKIDQDIENQEINFKVIKYGDVR